MTTEYTPNFSLPMPDFRMGPWHDLINGMIMSVDALLYTAMSNANVEPWANDINYPSGVSVIDGDDATVWVCVLPHTSPSAPTTFSEDRIANPDRWTQLLAGFAPRGEWANSTNYFPYDLSYSTAQGIFAICTTKHTSNIAGTIKDDAAFWTFLVDFSTADLSSANLVSYDNSLSGLSGTNVQDAIDQTESQIKALDAVNVSQGNQISTLQSTVSGHTTHLSALDSADTSLDSRLDAAEGTITNHTASIAAVDAAAVKLAGGQEIQAGYSVKSKSLGNLGNTTVDPWLGNYQFGNNVGAITITAPNKDGGVDLLITNTASGGGVSFSGFTVNPTNTGDPMTTTANHRFLVSMRRIGSVSTYTVKALQ